MRILFRGTAHPSAVSKSLKRTLTKHDVVIGIRKCEEAVAKMFGYVNWHELQKTCSQSAPESPRDDQISPAEVDVRNAQYAAAIYERLAIDLDLATLVVKEMQPSGRKVSSAVQIGAAVSTEGPDRASAQSDGLADVPKSKNSSLLRDILDGMLTCHRAGEDKPLQRLLAYAYCEKRKLAELAFAELNGWKFSGPRSFHLNKLAQARRPHSRYVYTGLEDHPLCYIGHRPGEIGRRGKIAIACQPYGPRSKFSETIAAWENHDPKTDICVNWSKRIFKPSRNPLVCHVPPAGPYASIWYPGATLFYVFTLPGVEVKWLPEQLVPCERYRGSQLPHELALAAAPEQSAASSDVGTPA